MDGSSAATKRVSAAAGRAIRKLDAAEANALATIREEWPFRHIPGYRNAIRLALFDLGRGKARGR